MIFFVVAHLDIATNVVTASKLATFDRAGVRDWWANSLGISDYADCLSNICLRHSRIGSARRHRFVGQAIERGRRGGEAKCERGGNSDGVSGFLHEAILILDYFFAMYSVKREAVATTAAA